ncbi:MAG: hypothetical protein GY756_26615 [bacterium]|nr:hypothetical protein [bacterium]
MRNIINKFKKETKAVTMTVPYISTVLEILQNSDFITLMPKMISEKYMKSYNLKIKLSPFEIPGVNFFIYWKKANNNVPSLNWIKTRFYEVVQTL